jgi:hypothetical protein
MERWSAQYCNTPTRTTKRVDRQVKRMVGRELMSGKDLHGRINPVHILFLCTLIKPVKLLNHIRYRATSEDGERYYQPLSVQRYDTHLTKRLRDVTTYTSCCHMFHHPISKLRSYHHSRPRRLAETEHYEFLKSRT